MAWIKTVLKLAGLSLLVGLVMAFFGITPGNVFERLGDGFREAFRYTIVFVEWAWTYILIGAILVVPLWLLLRLLRSRRRS